MKKILFRQHKGSLLESLDTATKVETLNDIENLPSVKQIEGFGITLNLESEFYCYDDRIKWNTYIITSKSYGVIGFTNGEVK